MHTSLECVPCFIRQALDAARFVTDDTDVHEMLVRKVLAMTAEMDLSQCPPALARQIHRILRQTTGVTDPYLELKTKFNNMALGMMATLETDVRQSADPLERAMRLAIAGNVIDFGVSGEITEPQAREAILNVMDEPFHGDVESFRQEISKAENILYLADNAGEIVFDRLLIQQLPESRVTVAVRGEPIINDAVMADAKAAGLCEIVRVIDNGSGAPGTILDQCNTEFRDIFANSDLIIAKGQGNFETLSDDTSNICFLFKVKCAVIAGHAGLPQGTHVMIHSPACTFYNE